MTQNSEISKMSLNEVIKALRQVDKLLAQAPTNENIDVDNLLTQANYLLNRKHELVGSGLTCDEFNRGASEINKMSLEEINAALIKIDEALIYYQGKMINCSNATYDMDHLRDHKSLLIERKNILCIKAIPN